MDIKKLEKQWLKKNKVSISNILQDHVWNIKLVTAPFIKTGNIVRDKTITVFKKTHIQWIESAFNGVKLHYKNIDWNN